MGSGGNGCRAALETVEQIDHPGPPDPAGLFVWEECSRLMKLLDAIGNTPLLELARVAAEVPGLRLYAKAEHKNPGGSVKDRPARSMLLDGIARGLLVPGKTILEATSGN